MSAAALESLLARIYTDDAFRRTFLADPVGVALGAGCDGEEAARLGAVDREGLELAAESFRRKRQGRGPAADSR